MTSREQSEWSPIARGDPPFANMLIHSTCRVNRRRIRVVQLWFRSCKSIHLSVWTNRLGKSLGASRPIDPVLGEISHLLECRIKPSSTFIKLALAIFECGTPTAS